MSAPPSRRRFQLRASMRLNDARQFNLLKEKGKRVTKGCLIANWLPRPEQPKSRLGVITSRKIGPSVTRSRARRLLREVFRQHQHELHSMDLILIARQSIHDKTFREVESDFLAALRTGHGLRPSE